MAGLVSCRIECVTKSALGADKAGEDERAEQVNERGGVNNLPTDRTSVVKAKLGNGVGACRLPFLEAHGSRRMVKVKAQVVVGVVERKELERTSKCSGEGA